MQVLQQSLFISILCRDFPRSLLAMNQMQEKNRNSMNPTFLIIYIRLSIYSGFISFSSSSDQLLRFTKTVTGTLNNWASLSALACGIRWDIPFSILLYVLILTPMSCATSICLQPLRYLSQRSLSGTLSISSYLRYRWWNWVASRIFRGAHSGKRWIYKGAYLAWEFCVWQRI